MLDVRRLRILKEVAVTGSVTGAASNLGYTHSAISQQLHALERETATQLIERNGRNIRLTPAAEILVSHAKTVLAQLERAEADLAAASGTIAGQVRLAALPTAMQKLVPQVLVRLRERYPDLELMLIDLEPEESLPALVQRCVDVAIVHSYELVVRNDPAELHEVELFSEPVLLVQAASGKDAGRAVKLAEYARAPWILPHPDTNCATLVERACAAAGFVPHPVAHTRDFAAAAALAAADVGVALIPQLGVQSDPRLAASRVMEPQVRRRIYLATRSGHETHPTIAAVVATIQECALTSANHSD